MSWCGVGGSVALEEGTVAGFSEYFTLLGDRFAAEDRHDGPTGNGQAFVRRVVSSVMHNFLADDFLAIGVPKHDVSIETNGDRSLLRIEAIHLGMISRGQGHKLICGDSSLHHTFAPQYWQPRFDSWDSIWDPSERSARFRTLFTLRPFKIERAMI